MKGNGHLANHSGHRVITGSLMGIAVALTLGVGAYGFSPSDVSKSNVKADEPAIRPRFTLEIPSVLRLLAETKRSHAGVFQRHLVDFALQTAAAPMDDDADAVDPDALINALENMKTWPDTSVSAALFAPDRQGRARWTLLLDWPLDDFRARFDSLRDSELGETLFEDVELQRTGDGTFELVLPTASLATLRDFGGQTLIASHNDLQPPSPKEAIAKGKTQGVEETEKPAPLFKCALHLVQTEKDSGATFLSKFSAITGADFEAYVDESGQWNDRLHIHWPPVTGTGAKILMGRIRSSFFVPGDAFGAMIVNSMMLPGILEGLAGFGPQVMMSQPGQVEIVGEAQVGPIARHSSSTICLSLLPGTGFFPMPDIVVQARAKSADLFEKHTRTAIEKINKTYRDREQSEPWHEVTVANHTVFWSDGSSAFPGAVMPLVMRPVLFLNKEKDAKGKQRDYLVMGWTSTSPEGFVKNWLNKPRTKNHQYLPSVRKTNGQVWVHWRQVYRWIHPYLNIALSGSGVDTLLPYADDIEAKLTSAMLTSKVKYTGLTLTHTGPLPMGVLAVPGLWIAATGIDESGGSDLSRERLASRHLRVLYHHAKLFRKDHGRWPAEVAELDGYVDFAGHPELLKLKLSSKQKWGDWFNAFVDPKKEKDEQELDEEDDPTADIDDDLYVIDWGKEKWQLGFAPGKVVHLESLYIDQDGTIHRKPKDSPKDDEEKEPRADATDNDVGETLKHAGSDVQKRDRLPVSPEKKKE